MEVVARCVRKHAECTPGEGTKARRTNADMKKPSRRILRERNGRVAAVQLESGHRLMSHLTHKRNGCQQARIDQYQTQRNSAEG